MNTEAGYLKARFKVFRPECNRDGMKRESGGLLPIRLLYLMDEEEIRSCSRNCNPTYFFAKPLSQPQKRWEGVKKFYR